MGKKNDCFALQSKFILEFFYMTISNYARTHMHTHMHTHVLSLQLGLEVAFYAEVPQSGLQPVLVYSHCHEPCYLTVLWWDAVYRGNFELLATHWQALLSNTQPIHHTELNICMDQQTTP